MFARRAPRRACLADAEQIAVCFAAYRADQGTDGPDDDEWAQIVEDEISSGRGAFFVAGRPVHSFAMASTFWSLWRQGIVAQVGYLWVDPALRRSGVGRRLMEACEQHARDCGHVRIELHANERNPEACHLYESLGWRDTNPAYGGGRDVRYYLDLG